MSITNKKRTFLAFTALEEFWHTSEPMIFLGKWCKLSHRKFLWEKLDAEVLCSSHGDYDHVEAYNYTIEIYEGLLPKIANWLNEIHKVENTLRYWRILIGPFLLIYIQIVYERLTHLKAAYALHPQLNSIGMAPKSYLTTINTHEFLSLSSEDAWNQQLFTQLSILGFKAPDSYIEFCWNADLKTRNKKISAPLISSKFTKIKQKLLQWYIKFRGSKIIDVCHYYHGFTKKNLYELFLVSKGRILSVASSQFPHKENIRDNKPNLLIRDKITNITPLDGFSKLVLETLKINLPLNFIEYYQEASSIHLCSLPYQPGVILAGAAWVYNDQLKFWAARVAEQKTKLVGAQHGGGYGALICHSYGLLERSLTDVYISWGWKSEMDVIPMPSTFICKRFLDCKTSNQFGTLWATNSIARYPYSVSASAFNPESYLQWQLRFVEVLNPTVCSEMLMRLSPSADSHYFQDCQKMFPQLTIEVSNDSISFYPQLYNAKIFITDVFGTTFNYSLAFNIPTIIFLDPTVWALTDYAKPYFKALHEVGIYHDCPESAAAMVNKIAANPIEWWGSERVQSARKFYCDTYARTSDHWLKEWSDLLVDIADGKIKQ